MESKLKRGKITLFIICVTIVFIGIETCVLTNEKKQMLTCAETTLKQSVNIDLNKRWKNANKKGRYSAEVHTNDSVIYPLVIYVSSKNGVDTIHISKEKDSQNLNPIKTEEKERFKQSILYGTPHAIRLDSLQYIWNSQLKQHKIDAPISLRLDYKLKSIYYILATDKLQEQQHCDSLPQHYVGYDFEYLLHSYVQLLPFTVFCHSLNGYNALILISYLIIIMLPLVLKRRSVYLNNIKKNDPNWHIFNYYISYNKKGKYLLVENDRYVLRKQLAVLFTLFAESENYEITTETLLQTIWPDQSGNDGKRRNLIRELRSSLPEKYFEIESMPCGIYRLEFINIEKESYIHKFMEKMRMPKSRKKTRIIGKIRRKQK